MLRSPSVGMAVALLAACGETPASPLGPSTDLVPALSATQVVSTNVSTPINQAFWVTCANGGSGESVFLVGALHQTFHVTQTGAGKLHVKYHIQPQGVVGTGMLTGTKFVATGVSQESFGSQEGTPHTFINNFRMIGQGSAVNFQVHETLHVTVNANGEVTSEVDNLRTTCE